MFVVTSWSRYNALILKLKILLKLKIHQKGLIATMLHEKSLEKLVLPFLLLATLLPGLCAITGGKNTVGGENYSHGTLPVPSASLEWGVNGIAICTATIDSESIKIAS